MADRFYIPPDQHMPQTAQAIITIGAGLGAVAAIAVAVRHWKRQGSAVPLFLLLGAGLALINEPLVDLLGKCYHKGDGQWQVFSLFNRPMPLWGLFGYVIIYGVTAWFFLAAMQRGASRRRLWSVVVAMCTLQIAAEMVILPTGIYYYYDYQPWAFFGMPIHWLAINFSGTFLTATVLAMTDRYLVARRQALVLFLPMTTQVLGSYFIGLPVFAALHSDAPRMVQWLGGAATIALAGLMIDLLARVVTRNPQQVIPAPTMPDVASERQGAR